MGTSFRSVPPLTLRQKQSLFVRLLGQLIAYVYAQGWELTLGEGLRSDRQGHMQNSLHYVALAQDLNLFIDGKYIRDGAHPAWLQIGLFWENQHPLARWGGRFEDSNHVSITHGGRA